MTEQEEMERLRFLLKEMLSTDPLTLTAALSLLPDHSNEAGLAVIQAAAHIGAENFGDTDKFVSDFKTLVLQAKETIRLAAEQEEALTDDNTPS